MSIRCVHCDGEHETIDEVRACAERHPNHPEPAAAGPMHCGQRMIPIVYGFPSHDMHERSGRGEIRLGGCLVGAFSPDWKCPVCGHISFDDAGYKTDGLSHITIGSEIDWVRVPHPPWWTQVKMRLQYWITRDV